mmetsp:Transcript_20704/g.30540  ORF Transcript_20704/g.30540 Transcript_20704/m.30540 type:complete len:752 (+) Transcript_20704:16-2271(+)
MMHEKSNIASQHLEQQRVAIEKGALRAMLAIEANNRACDLMSTERCDAAVNILNMTLLQISTLHTKEDGSSTIADHHSAVNKDSIDGSQNRFHARRLNGKYDEGMSTFSKPLFLTQHDSDRCLETHGIEVAIAFNLGIARSRYGDEMGAIRSFQKALSFSMRSLPDEDNSYYSAGPSRYKILHNLGHSYFKSGRYSVAASTYLQALESIKKKESQECSLLDVDAFKHSQLQVSAALNCIAIAKFHLFDDTDEVVALLQEALMLRFAVHGARHTRETATIFNNIGRVRFQRLELQAALEMYQEAYHIRTAIHGDEDMDVANILFNIGQIKEYQGLIPDAIKLYNNFLSIAQKSSEHADIDVANVLTVVGQLYYELNELSEASRFFSLSLASSKLAYGPHDIVVANVLNKIGNIYYDQGEYSKALEAYSEGLMIERKTCDNAKDNIAISLMNIASTNQHLCNYEAALSAYDEALSIRRHLRDEAGIATILTSKGLIYEEEGNLDLAAKSLEEAVAVRRHLEKGQSSILFPGVLNSLGLIRSKQGYFDLALNLFTDAINIIKTFQIVNPSDAFSLYFNAASVCKIMGWTDRALEYYKEALKQSMRIGPGVSRSILSENIEQGVILHQELGLLHQELKEWDEAIYHFQISARLCIENPLEIDRIRAFNAIKSLGDLHLKMENVDGATNAYSMAVRAFNGQTSTSALPRTSSRMSISSDDELTSEGNESDVRMCVIDRSCSIDGTSCLHPPASAAA